MVGVNFDDEKSNNGAVGALLRTDRLTCTLFNAGVNPTYILYATIGWHARNVYHAIEPNLLYFCWIFDDDTMISCYAMEKCHRKRRFWRSLTQYPLLKVLQVFCGLYSVMAFAKVGTFGKMAGSVDPETGWIIDTNSPENTEQGVILINGDLRALVANSNFQMFTLAISRLTAFSMYPGKSCPTGRAPGIYAEDVVVT